MKRLLLVTAIAAWAQGPAPPAAPQTATLAAGRVLAVRTSEPLSSKRSRKDDVFTATLDQRLQSDGVLIANRGARCEGRVVDAGKIQGQWQLILELTRFTAADGQKIAIHTAPFVKRDLNSRERDRGLPPRASVAFRIDQPVTVIQQVTVR